MTGSTPLQVVAAVLTAPDGRILLTSRPAGRAMAGYWEFPGGKIEPGEHAPAALRRELREELGVEAAVLRPLIRFGYRYPGREVQLDFWRATIPVAAPSAREGQELAWTHPRDLPRWALLPANRPLATLLSLGRIAAYPLGAAAAAFAAMPAHSLLPRTVLLPAPRRIDRQSRATLRRQLRHWQQRGWQVLLALEHPSRIPLVAAVDVVGWTLPDRRTAGRLRAWLTAWGTNVARPPDCLLDASSVARGHRPRMTRDGRLILTFRPAPAGALGPHSR